MSTSASLVAAIVSVTAGLRFALREVPLFGALAPSLLLYFLAALLVFVIVDRLVTRLGGYRLVWHPPLARFGLFVCLFSALVLST